MRTEGAYDYCVEVIAWTHGSGEEVKGGRSKLHDEEVHISVLHRESLGQIKPRIMRQEGLVTREVVCKTHTKFYMET